MNCRMVLIRMAVVICVAAALPSSTAAFDGYGVCASPFTKAEDEATRTAFPLLEQAGVRWVRLVFRWSEIEPVRGSFSFEEHDDLVALALKHRMRVLGVIVRTPRWANGDREEQAPPVDRLAWEHAVSRMAARYRGKIRHWQIGNEPDIRKFWTGSPDDYVRLLSSAYAVLKKADPDVQVVAAGLDGKGEDYLGLLLERGMARSCDIVAFHPYADTPEAVAGRVRSFRSVLARHGVNKPLWITEIGWQTGGWVEGPGKARDEKMKAEYLKRMYALLAPSSEVIFWYRAVEGPRLYGLIEHAGGRVKTLPAYESLSELTKDERMNE